MKPSVRMYKSGAVAFDSILTAIVKPEMMTSEEIGELLTFVRYEYHARDNSSEERTERNILGAYIEHLEYYLTEVLDYEAACIQHPKPSTEKG